MAPPLFPPFTRYDPCTPGWPAVPGVVAVWIRVESTQAHCNDTRGYHYAQISPRHCIWSLDDFQLDLARALEYGAQSNWNIN